MKKLLFLTSALCISISVTSQFSTSYNASSLGLNAHLIHNSISKSVSPSNFYAVASTLEINGGYDIYVTKVDVNGNTVWGKRIDINIDDRALDVLVDKNDDILVVGYTGNETFKQLYIVKLSSNGVLIKDFKLSAELNTVGTRIIESRFSGNYFVGGYEFTEEKSFDMPGNGILLEVDRKLTNLYLKSEYKQTDVNNTITDIVELPNRNLFLTGSIGGFSYGQVVMACIVNPNHNGDIISGGDFSFNVGSEFGLGASAVYDDKKDEIWLLFNSGTNSTPWYVAINKANTNAPYMNPKAYKVPKPGGSSDKMAGFKIVISPGFANSVTIFGYKEKTTFPAPATGFGFWMIDMKKYSLFPILPPAANTNVKYWNPSGTSTSSIENMGGDVLSLMSAANGNGAPYFHTPQMMLETNTNNKFVVVSYDDQSPSNIETNLTSFNSWILFASSSCFEQRDIQPFQQEINREESVEKKSNDISFINDIGREKKQNFVTSPYCAVLSAQISGSRSSNNTTDLETIENNDITFKVFPNPATDVLNISSSQAIQLKTIEIFNSVGQKILAKNIDSQFKNSKIDVSGYTNGVYIIQIRTKSNEVIVKRFVKG
ncbi:MAG: T9SS type A sorting domain-containing protein [Flavobacteriales bacterium]